MQPVLFLSFSVCISIKKKLHQCYKNETPFQCRKIDAFLKNRGKLAFKKYSLNESFFDRELILQALRRYKKDTSPILK